VTVGGDADEEWWKKEADDWGATGLPVEVVRGARGEAMARVRETLGLPERKKEGTPTALLLVHDTPRARLWAETYAMRLPGPAEVITTGEQWKKGWVLQPLAFEEELTRRQGDLAYRVFPLQAGEDGGLSADMENLAPPFRAESLMDGKGLPLAAGPFGGTTILVVPAVATDDQKAAWKRLEETDAIKKKSRFARLVVLTETGPADDAASGAEPGPAQVTGLAVQGLPAALKAVKDAGRSVVLVVPAVFCADAAMMAEIRAVARPYEEILDLSYLPGLGGGVLPPAPPSK
jgi:hypothetical protein